MTGQGQVLSAGGIVLKKGEFVEGRLVRGILNDKDGNRWEGTFNEQERLIGRGKAITADGEIGEGLFEDGFLKEPLK